MDINKILKEINVYISDYINPNEVNEIEWKRLIRKGKVQRKLICPDGFKAQDGRCVKMSPQETIKRKKSAKKRAKKLKVDKGKIAKLLRKRAKSLRKRAMLLPNTATEKN